MLSLALSLAGAPLPPPLTADQGRQLRCVAVLDVLASAQERGVAAALEFPPVAEQGARFAQSVIEAFVQTSGRDREQVRDVIAAHVPAVQAEGAAASIAEVKRCVALMDATVPRSPPPTDEVPPPLPTPRRQ